MIELEKLEEQEKRYNADLTQLSVSLGDYLKNTLNPRIAYSREEIVDFASSFLEKRVINSDLDPKQYAWTLILELSYAPYDILKSKNIHNSLYYFLNKEKKEEEEEKKKKSFFRRIDDWFKDYLFHHSSVA